MQERVSETLKVLLLSASADPVDGWGNITCELCQQFWQSKDIQFDLHIPSEANVGEGLSFKTNISKKLPKWVPTFMGNPIRLLDILRYRQAERYDLIHTLVEFPYGILARQTASQLRIPYIISTQGTYAVLPFQRWLDTWLYRPAIRDASTITAPSKFTADNLRLASGINRPVDIVHNAVNYQRFQKLAGHLKIRQSLGIPDGAQIILGVGALKPRKGFDLLIRAFSIVVKSAPNAYLVIAGEGRWRSKLEALAVKLGVADSVCMPGIVRGDDLVGLYQACEIYSHLPRYHLSQFEGFGIVYLEASACGKPVVGTNSGGVSDAVLDRETGFLVDEDDYKAAARAISTLLQDQDLRRRMGDAGRRYAERHTWKRYADRMIDIYRNVVQTKGQGK